MKYYCVFLGMVVEGGEYLLKALKASEMLAKVLFCLFLFLIPLETSCIAPPLSPPTETSSIESNLPIKPGKKKRKKRRKKQKNSSERGLHWSSIYLLITLGIAILAILWIFSYVTGAGYGIVLLFPILFGIQMFISPFLSFSIQKGINKNKHSENINIASLLALGIMSIGVGAYLLAAIINPWLFGGAFYIDIVFYIVGFELIMFGGLMILLLISLLLNKKPSKDKVALVFVKVFIGLALFFLPILFGLATSIFYSIGSILVVWLIYWLVNRMKSKL